MTFLAQQGLPGNPNRPYRNLQHEKINREKIFHCWEGLPFAGLGMRRFKDISCLITQPGEVARFVW